MKLKLKLIGVTIACLLFSCNGEMKKDTAPPDSDMLQDSTENNVMKPDTVNRPELVTVQPDSSLLLTAENGRPIGPSIKYMPEWKAFGWFTSADSVQWEVDVRHPGEYEVHLNWSVSDEDAGKKFLLQAKDKQLTGVVGKTGSWKTYKIENVGKIKLSEGVQKIIFRSKAKADTGALLDLRQIKLMAVK